METPLIITDVTRMSGSRVCVAGITEDGRTIRPTLPFPGIQEDWLYTNKQCVIRPFSEVVLGLLCHQSNPPPHTEDWVIDPAIKKFTRILDNQEKKDLLNNIAFPKVSDIFEAEIHTDIGNYIREGEGVRSLGTIKAQSIAFVSCEEKTDELKTDEQKNMINILFKDASNQEYSLAVTDLTFRYYVNYLHEIEGLRHGSIGLKVQRLLNQRETYLRIGLTRPTWKKYPHRCFLQINGVYSFPDYLDGRCFADFQPKQNKD